MNDSSNDFSRVAIATPASKAESHPKHRTPLRRRLTKLLAAAANLAGLLPALLARRSAGKWVFGHEGGAFAGNPKYLFLWMSLHRPDIGVTWITGSRETRRALIQNGFTAYMRWSWRGIGAALTAKVFVFAHDASDVNASLSRGAMRLNLWHGVGLKALQVGRATGWGGWLRRALSIPHDRVVTTSDMMQVHFATQFGLPLEQCPQLGYPRLDCGFDSDLASAAVTMDRGQGFQMNHDLFAETYIYLPTYRDTKRPFLDEALPDLERLNTILAARNSLLYIKPHPRTADVLLGSFPNIRLWPGKIDIYAYLTEFTGLITDYSSVLYDYLFVKSGGVILYTFDFEDYIARDRELLYSYDDNIAGLRVSTFDALCEALARGSALDPVFAEAAAVVRERFWGGSFTPAAPAVVDYVQRVLRD